MHPFLEHLSIFTLSDLVKTEMISISFFQDVGLIPNRHSKTPACPKCHGPMVANTYSDTKLGFRWRCSKRLLSVNPCKTLMSPLKHTFFDNMHIPFTDAIGLIIGFVMEISMNEIQRQIIEWRSRRRDKKTHLNIGSICDFYKKLKSVCETVVAQNSELQEVKGRKKSYLDCYRLKRLNPLPTLGHRVHTILMDIKSTYPGKKLTISSTDSLDTESASVTVENDVSVDISRTVTLPTIAIKAANSLNSENVDLLNEVTRNLDASSDTEGSYILGIPFENTDVPLEPEVILHANDDDSHTHNITDPSVASSTNKNASFLHSRKDQQSKRRKVQPSAEQKCQEKSSDKSDFLYPNKKGRILFFKRMPFNEYLEKNKNISTEVEKEKGSTTQPLIHKIELSENTQCTVNSDQSTINS